MRFWFVSVADSRACSAICGALLAAALGAGCAGMHAPAGPARVAAPKAAEGRAGALVAYTEEREACANRNPRRNAYFGDLHVHTSYSYDALPLGATTTPADAYRYARGEQIVLPPHQVGGPATRVQKIGAPLDFAAVTDHSEFLGELELCADEESAAYGSRSCETYRKGGPPAILVMARGLSQDLPSRNADICGEDGRLCLEASATRWRLIRQMAEEAYDRSSRCEFTTFVAYEHSGTPDNNPYHRNVIFRNGRVPRLPVSYFEAPTDIELWDRLTSECLEGLKDCDVLAIPHSSNLSSGVMFSSSVAGSGSRQSGGQSAHRRNRLEPVMEIIQHKGSSECFNGLPGILGEPDVLCDMEQLRRYFRGLPAEGNTTPICEEGETGRGGALNTGCVSKNDFFRSVLLTGLQNKKTTGVNPYKFGVIGSTDTHLSTAGAVDESGWQGHTVSEIDRVERLTASRVHASGLYTNPGGLAGIWAVENSRDALFDALQRREVFGTSGPRIRPRLFGGWDFPESACVAPVRAGYAGGVPMGADLPKRASQKAPRFIVMAERDPSSAPLLRVQVIKGWVDESDQAHYKVFDVAGDAESAGSLELDTGEWNGPAHDSLCTVFEDPEFDPAQASYYYMRAVEAPSLRWSWRQCLELPPGQRPAECKNSAPKVTQELAWTSPIWYQAETD